MSGMGGGSPARGLFDFSGPKRIGGSMRGDKTPKDMFDYSGPKKPKGGKMKKEFDMCVAVNGTWDVPNAEIQKLMDDSLEEHEKENGPGLKNYSRKIITNRECGYDATLDRHVTKFYSKLIYTPKEKK